MGMEISKCFSYTFKLIPLEPRFLLFTQFINITTEKFKYYKNEKYQSVRGGSTSLVG